jgi:hypothetical protein
MSPLIVTLVGNIMGRWDRTAYPELSSLTAFLMAIDTRRVCLNTGMKMRFTANGDGKCFDAF